MKPKQERRELEKLYAQVPTFECIPGCHDCCGPVDGTREELRKAPRLKAYEGQLNFFMDAGIVSSTCATCPYVSESGCGIYDERPFICRLFGATEEKALKCPHGRGPEKKLSLAETQALVRRYRKLMPPPSETKIEVSLRYKAWQDGVEEVQGF